jgi:hypothetical protein
MNESFQWSNRLKNAEGVSFRVNEIALPAFAGHIEFCQGDNPAGFQDLCSGRIK